MSSYATIETVEVPNASLSSPPSVAASANWGAVYQNYISTNLSSEELAKGAYDAYNLLTTRNLYKFSNKVSIAIQNLSNNVNSIDSALKTNFDTLYAQVAELKRVLNSLLAGTGDVVIGNLKVQQISFVNTPYSQVDFSKLNE